MYSDGLVENTNSRGEMLSDKWLKNYLIQNANLSTSEFKEGLVAECERFWGEQPREDDVTFIVIDWKNAEQRQDKLAVVS